MWAILASVGKTTENREGEIDLIRYFSAYCIIQIFYLQIIHRNIINIRFNGSRVVLSSPSISLSIIFHFLLGFHYFNYKYLVYWSSSGRNCVSVRPWKVELMNSFNVVYWLMKEIKGLCTNKIKIIIYRRMRMKRKFNSKEHLIASPIIICASPSLRFSFQPYALKLSINTWKATSPLLLIVVYHIELFDFDRIDGSMCRQFVFKISLNL